MNHTTITKGAQINLDCSKAKSDYMILERETDISSKQNLQIQDHFKQQRGGVKNKTSRIVTAILEDTGITAKPTSVKNFLSF